MKKIFRTISSISLVAYIGYLLYLVFLSPYYGRGYFHRNYNFVPCKTIIEYLLFTHGLKATIINIGGNISAFIPMGLLTPIVLDKYNNFKNIAIVVLISTTFIEIMQFIVGVGTCDIDDIILNFIGGIIGFYIYKLIKKAKTSF